MRCSTLWFVAVSFAMLPACDSGGAEGAADDSHASPEASQAGCIGLSQAECEATPHCLPIHGTPTLDDCSYGDAVYAGCWTGEAVEDGEVVAFECNQISTWAHPANSATQWYRFPDSCVPDGWVAGDGDIACAAPCEGLPEADCGATAHCFPIRGTPILEDCSYGATVYAGCWTGEKVEDGEVVALTCSQVGTWARPADSATEWYLFSDSCVPDGWATAEQSPCE